MFMSVWIAIKLDALINENKNKQILVDNKNAWRNEIQKFLLKLRPGTCTGAHKEKKLKSFFVDIKLMHGKKNNGRIFGGKLYWS